MRSPAVSILLAVIVIAMAGGAYYYWTGGGKASAPGSVTGVVVEKMQRAAGTEAGDKPLAQGMRVLSGRTNQQESFYFLRVKAKGGAEVEIEVPRDFFQKIQEGDTIQQATPESRPVLIMKK